MVRRFAAALAQLCFALGGLWALAGALRYVFGVAVTVPVLPPLALERVHVVPAFAMALACAVLGALAGRVAHTVERRAAVRAGRTASLAPNVVMSWTPTATGPQPVGTAAGRADELGR